MMTCNKCAQTQEELRTLRHELEEWQRRCNEAEAGRQQARDELQALESEMDELHDNFKEEENEQFEQVKQELDACLKNCKILQIRLAKSERQYGQLEQVKQMLERQLEERAACELAYSSTNSGRDRSKQDVKQLNVTTNGDLLDASNGEFIRVNASEYDQMLRDLNDTSERERDLQEQIKYSQEEAQLKGERLQAVEAENEILLKRINKLTLANSSLRSNAMQLSLAQESSSSQHDPKRPTQSHQQEAEKVRELCEQNEQLKLALELAQSEGERLKKKIQETSKTLEARELAINELEAKLKSASDLTTANNPQDKQDSAKNSTRLELECRQLRARLVHSERECRQLRSQLESLGHGSSTIGRRSPSMALGGLRSHSMESGGSPEHQMCPSSKCQESMRALDHQCKSLLDRNNQLELKLQKLIEMSSQNLDQQTNMETDLLEKLKRQLDTSESELAKARSRLVELDIECSRAQRQYKRLLSSLESCGSSGGEFQLLRRNKVPSESSRDTLSRQELRQAIRELELDVDDLMTLVRAKEALLKERSQSQGAQDDHQSSSSSSQDQTKQQQTTEEQLKSVRRLLDQEQLLSNNLKLDVANLEQDNHELQARAQMLERERVAMEEEMDKLRQLMGEMRAELEDSEQEKVRAQNKSRDLAESLEKLKIELKQVRSHQQEQQAALAKSQQSSTNAHANKMKDGDKSRLPVQQTDLLVMARDLSELKVKNGFLMRQLEMAREDTARQLEELRVASEAQQRRAVELAQIELKERHLQESQQLRDELSELRQKVAQFQRQATRQEEEAALERDRARAIERDWRRDKSQWQQTREQLEGQLAIEKRSSEFRLKEVEAATRDKERQLTSIQDRYVQLERDLKRLQNKYHLLEEDNESKIKQLTRDLELKSKDLTELQRQKQMRDEQQYETMKRLQGEKTTLKETLETIRRSYDEKLVESRQLRELLQSRQEQAYRERTQLAERVDGLQRRLNETSELETQTKLLKQRLEIQERQLELTRRELSSAKEERTKLRDRCDELEKRELITKTSSISGLAPAHHHHHSFLKPFGSKAQLVGRSPADQNASSMPHRSASTCHNQTSHDSQQGNEMSQQLIEKLSGKINDQRNLINILRQQLTETQMELKQVKLLQASERSKWQANVALLTGRLNECEEKLAFETLLLQHNPKLIDQLARPKLDSSWAHERQANADLIKQQQTQIELLVRDLKKTSQAHDMLRLHGKQLESHNNKLSKKLIEYQQQSSMFNRQDKELAANYDKLLASHTKLELEVRPLVEIVSKIVASLDAPEQQLASSTKSYDSTERPLRAGTLSPHSSRFESEESENELSITTPRPAHQMNQTQTSRLTRLLAGGKSSGAPGPGCPDSSQGLSGTNKSTSKPTKTLKRVRIKCSTLGITTSEKKQLKQHLKTLAESLESFAQGPRNVSHRARACSETSTHCGPVAGSTVLNRLSTASSRPLVKSRASMEPIHRTVTKTKNSSGQNQGESDQSSQQSHASKVHWQLDSDLESERSWSLEPASTNQRNVDMYRRFPQATPSGRSTSRLRRQLGTSLTDYESEDSIASDYSVSAAYSSTGCNRPRASGAESDSGLATSSSRNGSRKSSSGFKGRLRCTLRNISRSITGLGSDTDDVEPTTSSSSSKRLGCSKSKTRGAPAMSDDDDAGPSKWARQSILKEIQV